MLSGHTRAQRFSAEENTETRKRNPVLYRRKNTGADLLTVCAHAVLRAARTSTGVVQISGRQRPVRVGKDKASATHTHTHTRSNDKASRAHTHTQAHSQGNDKASLTKNFPNRCERDQESISKRRPGGNVNNDTLRTETPQVF